MAEQSTSLFTDIQELARWRQLLPLVEKFKQSEGAEKVTALVDGVMFVLDRIAPGEMHTLRLLLVRAQAAVATEPNAKSFAELLISLMEEPPSRPVARAEMRPAPRSQTGGPEG